MPRPKLKFFCFKTRKKITTNKYGLIIKKNKKTKKPVHLAVTTNEKDKCFRIVSKQFYNKWKKV